jgi:N-acetylglucosaminyl-diphospho-decaprenol L-rhamnosyltransferase
LIVSVILVSYNTAKMTLEVLKALDASICTAAIQVLVVDNASKDNSVSLIKQHYPNIRLIENKKNVGFGRANNQILGEADGDFVLLLNTDAFVEEHTIQKTVDFMISNPRCGVLGVRLVGLNQDQQPSCRFFPTPVNDFLARTGLYKLFTNVKLIDDVNWDPTVTRSCDWVPGCFYLIRKQVISDVGLFDPIFFLYSEEVDHCFAVKKAGWDVQYFSEVSVVHVGGESAKSDGAITSKGKQLNQLQVESEMLYFRKNHGFFSCILHFFLSIVADIFLNIKFILKGNVSSLDFFSTFKLRVIALFKTRVGSKPVR